MIYIDENGRNIRYESLYHRVPGADTRVRPSRGAGLQITARSNLGQSPETRKADLPEGQPATSAIYWSGREDLNLRPLGPEPNVHKLIFE